MNTKNNLENDKLLVNEENKTEEMQPATIIDPSLSENQQQLDSQVDEPALAPNVAVTAEENEINSVSDEVLPEEVQTADAKESPSIDYDFEDIHEEWKNIRWQWYLEYGLTENDIRWHRHEKLAHYASEAYDIEYNFKTFGGFKEIEGIHARGNWDLSQHSKFSGQDLSYTDEAGGEKFIPHILETSAGLNRMFLMFLDKAYTEEDIGGETRLVLKFDKRLSPIKAAVFPLLKNKPELVKLARQIYEAIRVDFMCEFDDNGNIGKRYRRQDEIGTPYCITVDFDSLEKNDVTVRDRDTMEQIRIKIPALKNYFSDQFRK